MGLTKNILVADDDPGILEAISIVLTEGGYEVTTVENPLEAVAKIKDTMPDLVLLDLWMPKMSGEDICREVKTNSLTKDIPVILLSASNKTGIISKSCQADDYLEKPFDMNELLTKVKKFTD